MKDQSMIPKVNTRPAAKNEYSVLLIGLYTLTNHPTITRRIQHPPVHYRLEPHRLCSDIVESVLKCCNVLGINDMVCM